MPQRLLEVGSEPDRGKLANEIVGNTYVSPSDMAADLKAVEKSWAAEVQSASGGVYRGEIRDYHREPGPMVTGDLRDTWSICVVDRKGKVIAYAYFLPWQEDDDEYGLTDDVLSGFMSLGAARKEYTRLSKHQASTEFENWLEAGGADRLLEIARRGKAELRG